MSKKVFYFVDYENVHEAGIVGMNTLPKDGEVHLFYSQNANKLNLDLLRFVKAKVQVHKVKPGKQSLDMQMVSYLGYCIGEEDEEGTFILVSKDTDYANTVLFWREEGVEVRVQPAILEEKNADGMERALRSVKITRRGRRGGRRSASGMQASAPQEVKEEAQTPEEKAENVPETEAKEENGDAALKETQTTVKENTAREQAKDSKAAASETEKPAEAVKEDRSRSSRGGRRRGRPRTDNQEAVKPLSAENKTSPATAGAPAEKATAMPEKPLSETKTPEPKDSRAEKEEKTPAVRNNKVPEEPSRVTVTVHDVPMITHAVPQGKEPKAEKSPTALRVQAFLTEKKTDPAVIRKLISIVQKHEEQKNSRQAIYMEIRKTFGQKMGVDLYNSFKGLLK